MPHQPSIYDFPIIETSLASKIKDAWLPLAEKYIAQIKEKLVSGDEVGAIEIVNGITFDEIVNKLDGYIELQMVNAMLLGNYLSSGNGTSKLISYDGGQLPPLFDAAKTQLKNMLVTTAVEAIKELALFAIHDYVDLTTKVIALKEELLSSTYRLPGDVRVEQLRKATAEVENLADALNVAVNRGGTVAAEMSANLMTSRLVSYGFLSQAHADGVVTYQITEILDDRICPFCRMMHGKKFSVDLGLAHIEAALMETDPQALKSIAPWPKQTKENMSKYKQMSPSELAANGWDVPPYHPGCRGITVPLGTVGDDEVFDIEPEDDGPIVVQPAENPPGYTVPPPPAPAAVSQVSQEAINKARGVINDAPNVSVTGMSAPNGKYMPAVLPVEIDEIEYAINQLFTAKDAEKAVTENVNLADVKVFQPALKKSSMLSMLRQIENNVDLDEDGLPLFIRYQNQTYVWDGDYRSSIHKLLGLNTIKARVLDID